jgi:phosphatidylserine/phosphatidylglycerophosphate/cardiolipin synthase-like enzyme
LPEFVTTHGICDRLDEIMKEAEEELVLVSPYLSLSTDTIQRLRDADRRGVKIDLIYGKKDPHAEEWEKLESLKNLSIHFFADLHAKCYFNEKELIITSMNLLDSSRKNREMGVWVKAGDNDGIYRKAVAEAQSILESSEHIKTRARKGTLAKIGRALAEAVNVIDSGIGAESGGGFCIRCRREIPFDLGAPYCKECYWTWSRLGGNVKYREQWCHDCGVEFRTTFVKPRCGECYDKSD